MRLSLNKFPCIGNRPIRIGNGFIYVILVEILIDRYLLIMQPDIADNFYASYKKFDFQDASRVFTSLKHFDNHKFISFANDVANSTFLKEYVDDYLIISILNQICSTVLTSRLVTYVVSPHISSYTVNILGEKLILRKDDSFKT